jgi:hypothetical protein
MINILMHKYMQDNNVKEYFLGSLIVLAFMLVPGFVVAKWLGSVDAGVAVSFLGLILGIYFVINILDWD